MDFHEEAVDTGCRCRSCEVRDEFTLAAGGIAHTSRELDTVGRIKNDRIAELSHDGEGTHIDHEIVVAEGRPSFRQSEVRISCFFHLADDIFHIFRRHELALLHVDRLSCLRCAVYQVGLAAEEGRDLEHVEHLGGWCELGHIMYVREYRHLEFLLDIRKDLEALLKSRPTEGMVRGTVRLIKRRLENVLYAKAFTDLFDLTADHQRAVIAFNDAGACDQKQLAAVNGQISDMNGFHRELLYGVMRVRLWSYPMRNATARPLTISSFQNIHWPSSGLLQYQCRYPVSSPR